MEAQSFQTRHFRVQITGRNVWVDTKEGEEWLLRSHHTLPLPAELLSDSTRFLAQALAEAEPSSEARLRQMLTGKILPMPKRVPRVTPLPKPEARTAAKVRREFRSPLQPPISKRTAK